MDSIKKEKYIKYMEGVLRWNEFVNLTAITDKEQFWVKHIEDSLSITDVPEYVEAKRILDIGTGAGFPGAILAINNPEKDFYLLDALQKRLDIVDELTEEAGATNVTTLHGRAEDYGNDPEFRETFDLVVSRAVGSMPVLTEYALPFVKIGGYFIGYRGRDEINYDNALKRLGGEYVRTDSDKMEKFGMWHNLIIIKKVSPTPKKYPRKAGTAQRYPIK